MLPSLLPTPQITLGSTALPFGVATTTVSALTLSGPTLSGTSTLSGFTAGSVLFAGTSAVLSQDNSNFFWSSSNSRLGLGTASPSRRLHVSVSTANTARIRVDETGDTTGQQAGLELFASGVFKGGFFKDKTAEALVITDAATARLTVAQGGNVGIGTLTPLALLHVGTTAGTARVYNSYTDVSNGEWAYMGDWGFSSNVAAYGTNKNGSGTARDTVIVTGGTIGLRMHATTQLIALGPSAALTSSFPALKRSTTTLQARLADDSGFTKIQGQLQIHQNAVAETITPDHTIVIYDAAGQAYRVPCVV